MSSFAIHPLTLPSPPYVKGERVFLTLPLT